MEKLLGIAVYFQSSIRSQRLDKDTRESTYLLSIQSGALPFWRQKTGENVLWLETNKEGENGKSRAAPHFRLLTSHWNAVSCSLPPPTRGPHLESVNGSAQLSSAQPAHSPAGGPGGPKAWNKSRPTGLAGQRGRGAAWQGHKS